MSVQNSQNLSLDNALKLLKTLSCTDSLSVTTAGDRQQIAQALLLVVNASEYQNIGICADSVEQALTALVDYLTAFEYPLPGDLTPVPMQTPVYLKFNTRKLTYYLDTYTGDYRGVLVSCQSSENESLNGTYGHFPLDLFASV